MFDSPVDNVILFFGLVIGVVSFLIGAKIIIEKDKKN